MSMFSKSQTQICLLLFSFLLLKSLVQPSENLWITTDGTVRQEEISASIIQTWEQEAFRVQGEQGRGAAVALWEKILAHDDRNGNALVQTGLHYINDGINYSVRERGIQYLSRAFLHATRPIPMPTPPGIALAMVIGRYRWEQRNFVEAHRWLRVAQLASRELKDSFSNPCVEASVATMLHPFPDSTKEADEMMEQYLRNGRDFLEISYDVPTLKQHELWLASNVAGSASDPYVHCILTIFHLSFYYRADVAAAAQLHASVATRLWPQLTVEPPLRRGQQPSKKIRLGIASGFLTPQSSVAADFGGVLQRLNRDIFHVSYIVFQRDVDSPVDPFVYRQQNDTVLLLSHDPGTDLANGAWVTRFHEPILDLELDILLYLDLTMNPVATRVAMARLAPVQATSHGHPLTSGVQAVDYFISWGAAELPTAASHYSEKLVLLNASVPHQYYTLRHDGIRSLLDGGDFRSLLRREVFAADHGVPVDGHWYTCMQKPHKFMPEMDPLLCGILNRDREARILLHDADTSQLRDALRHRLLVAGCTRSQLQERVHFIPTQPHHRLLALYNVSSVILDSYPAGGCTTTREVLELSQVVVTWPARLLGGRWSFAYYTMFQDPELLDHTIADSAEDYIQKAVAVGKNATLRYWLGRRIKERLHESLYERWDAVHSWENVLLQIAPSDSQ